jgi:uncharacterized protein YjbI with pentapeptide repeats
MADNKIPYARRHPYKAILWFVVLAGSVVGLIAAFSGRRYFEILAVVVVLIALIGLIRLGYHREWTGFGTAEISKPGDKEIRPRKTLWDWLGLLIVPGVLALGALWFSWAQDNRQRVIEDRRAQAAQQVEDRRAQAAQQVEEQRAQEEALQAYLDQMSDLMLNQDLRNSDTDSEVRTLAQARTATVIQRLDAEGNRNVIRFLNEAGLTGETPSAISLLEEADLQGAYLEGVDLSFVDLKGAILSDADLSKADLSDADLSGAVLSGANLSKANLSFANLLQANLSKANLNDADLSDADLKGGAILSDADLSKADLSWANLNDADLSKADLIEADLREADLNEADLSDADLSGAVLNFSFLAGADLSGARLREADLTFADLRGTDLSKADLSDADLSMADLTNADLTNAVGITNEKLEQQAASFDGATMPDGATFGNKQPEDLSRPEPGWKRGE